MVIKNISVILKIILTDLALKNYANTDITKLVQVTRAILVSHIRNSLSSIIFLCQKHGISINDIAIDCIADIFAKGEDGKYPKLENFFHSLRNPISDMPEIEIFLAWKSLLLKLAESQVSHLYAQIDPAGFKIQRNIKETIANCDFFRLHKNVNGTVLIIPSYELFNTFPPVQIEEIESDFLYAAKQKRNTKDLLKNLHEILVDQTRFRKEIKLSDAVKLFKRAFNYSSDNDHFEEEFSEYHLANSFLDEMELEQICSKVLANVKEKILLNYFAKNRLTSSQSEAVYITINNLVYDWRKTGCSNHSLYKYFNENMNINEREYNLIIKDKIEYLVKLTKKEFSIYLISKE